ncbi:4-hydroxythreonine-4-phosphate dehydrogenase PdxA [Leptolyngbya sp. 'hensonii']|uniref:4-hydroxythreonine-4-phosphate dehydrogenase PdxA n=1 Tax=Leptolyngbya sp. 'hensonii' TaxID=1922337 RepID=UPI0009F91A9F|nr:4-hydroxythreonine-4-phosphate dehydrogenase PdxA [Leptolyngbya sp. 'hensonii']
MPEISPSSPHLAVTLGDPAGIGPEVILKALADRDLWASCTLTVVGSRRLLEASYQRLHQAPHLSAPIVDPAQLSILDIELDSSIVQAILPGQGNAASGEASFIYLMTAIQQTLAGQFDGIVTGPISKAAWTAAGHPYPGQTELLAEQAGVTRYGMLFVARSPHTGLTLRTLLATTHIPLCQVPGMLGPELLSTKLNLLLDCLERDFGLTRPSIAIAGLNPHSGEQGQLGREEQDWLIPWLQDTRLRLPHLILDGPIPPDTLWVKPGQAWYGPHAPLAHDAYLALYHDQGLIPVKLLAFDRAVNTSIGLPFIRTSPDHGTAFDIVDRGIADATSLRAAIQFAIEISNKRKRSL